MTTLDQLEALADAAMGVPTKTKDAAFQDAANPATIKSLVALCRLQHDTIIELMYANSTELAKGKYMASITAYDRFNGGAE